MVEKYRNEITSNSLLRVISLFVIHGPYWTVVSFKWKTFVTKIVEWTIIIYIHYVNILDMYSGGDETGRFKNETPYIIHWDIRAEHAENERRNV